MVNCCDNKICGFIWKWFTPIVRFWGVISAVVIWIICIRHIQDKVEFFAIYLVVVAAFTALLETVFFFEPCITKCCNPDGCCGKFWMIVCWFDNWKRAIVYVGLSIGCYLDDKYMLTIVAGIMLDILAILYILRTYRIHGTDPKELQPGQTTSSGKTYGRFENEDLRGDKEFKSIAADDIEAQEDIIQKEGNPFGKYGGTEDDDADPRGDAGLPSRYPP